MTQLCVSSDQIDAFGHVNNAVYLQWLDEAAWAHSNALGVTIERCLELGRGMAVMHTSLHYLRAAVAGDVVEIATWLAPAARPLCVLRCFELRRLSDDAIVLKASIEYTCIDLVSGRPAKWPGLFRQAYVPTGLACPTSVGAHK